MPALKSVVLVCGAEIRVCQDTLLFDGEGKVSGAVVLV